MFLYYVLVSHVGAAFPVVVWQGDDPEKARAAYEAHVNDREADGAYVILCGKGIGVEYRDK